MVPALRALGAGTNAVRSPASGGGLPEQDHPSDVSVTNLGQAKRQQLGAIDQHGRGQRGENLRSRAGLKFAEGNPGEKSLPPVAELVLPGNDESMRVLPVKRGHFRGGWSVLIAPENPTGIRALQEVFKVPAMPKSAPLLPFGDAFARQGRCRDFKCFVTVMMPEEEAARRAEPRTDYARGGEEMRVKLVVDAAAPVTQDVRGRSGKEVAVLIHHEHTEWGPEKRRYSKEKMRAALVPYHHGKGEPMHKRKA